MSTYELSYEVRSDLGKGASRRLRRNTDGIPAIVYGGKGEPKAITLLTREVVKLLENEAAFSHVLTLKGMGGSESVLIKDLQRHPAKPIVMHIDFQRVVAGQKLTAHIPLHFINEESCLAVKQQGGEISHMQAEVEVSCLPKDLPEFIEVDMLKVEVGQTIHLSEIKLPKGVELVQLSHGNDLPVANIHAARAGSDETDASKPE